VINIKTAPESRKITQLIKAIREESLVPQADFQRRAVWTNKDKIAFIDTILGGFPFPEIYVATGSVDTSTGEAIEYLVDGQQRMRTLVEYFTGAPPFKRTKAIELYKNLSEEQKKAFLNYDVSVRNLGILDEAEIIEIFRRMNMTSYDLNDMERFNAVYLGEFKNFCEETALQDLFAEKRIFSPADIRRMKDVSFIASLTATMMSDYFHHDDEVENYLERYNEEFEQRDEISARYDAAIKCLIDMDLDRSSRAWKKADFYTLFIELDRALHRDAASLDAKALGTALQVFFEKVENARKDPDAPVPDKAVSDYLAATLQSTNDRSARVARASAIRPIILRTSDKV